MYLGVDLGGTKIAFALAAASGKLTSKIVLPSELTTAKWIENVSSGIKQIVTSANVSFANIKAIGVGTPDLTVVFEGRETTMREPLTQALGRFNLPLFIDNDANTAALGEQLFGQGRGRKNFIYLILGTGIGGAAVINGQLYRGATGRAGEFGHLSVEAKGIACACGNRGCLHLYASGRAIAGRALKLIAERKALDSLMLKLIDFKGSPELAQKLTAEVVFAAARKGDPIASEVIADARHYLGVGITSLINIFNPEIVILGGGLLASADLIIEPLNQAVARSIRKELFGVVEIKQSLFGADAGVIGAVALAQQGLPPGGAN